MIGRLKEAVEYYNQLGEVHEIHLKTLLNFADSAIESEGKWPQEFKCKEHFPGDGGTCIKCYASRFANHAIADCLAAHAAEKAEVEKRNKFSSRTILAGIKYEKLSPEKKDLADKLLKII
jgi:predicted adenine nucleotide alpha hydrolase (AANH) superfamily ATPase